MARLRLKYVRQYVDHTGKIRIYFKRPRSANIALPGLPGSREFREAYEAALEATRPASEPRPQRSGKPQAGTLDALIADYYRSALFVNLKPITKSTYRNEMERLRREHGDKPVKQLDRRGVMKLMSDRADRPGAANQVLKMIRILIGFAIMTEIRTDDPTLKIKKMKIAGDGFIAWREEDIEAFEAAHPVGSKARLALALLVYTAQRRGDVIRIAPRHIRHGVISFVQSKTDTALEIPIHPDLAEIISASTVGLHSILTTNYGQPFTPAGFGNWFRDRCKEAGLPKGYNAHGLRKASLRRLAEAGCTTKQIMAISGHKDMEEVEKYVRAAEQKLLARQAVAMMPGGMR